MEELLVDRSQNPRIPNDLTVDGFSYEMTTAFGILSYITPASNISHSCQESRTESLFLTDVYLSTKVTPHAMATRIAALWDEMNDTLALDAVPNEILKLPWFCFDATRT
jgi:hypothetical protein